MNKINYKIKAFGMAALVGLTTVSCDLDLLPLNEVVLENFWKQEDDVQSVVNSCYVGMQEGGYVEKLITWGELRSDNVNEGPDCPENLKQMMKGNLLETNGACDWGPLYTVINRCNTVIYYAPQVAEKDPNYTESDLRINLAEVKALRALSFFYLIRSFKDVPFSLDPSIDDFQEYQIPATPHRVILDSLILDLEACKDDAPRKYADANTTNRNNTGRITRNAIYTLLADMYLWKASDAELPQAEQDAAYRRCIECCDYVLKYKIDQYKVDETGNLRPAMDTDVYNEYGYPLLAEQKGTTQGAPAAFNAIFAKGNSFESIFELTYMTGNNDIKNTDVSTMYGGMTKDNKLVQKISSNELLIDENVVKNSTYSDNNLFSVNSDYRSLVGFQFISGKGGNIRKYVTGPNGLISSTSYGTLGPSWSAPSTSSMIVVSYQNSYMGWILYRLSEVMLMRAEAEINLANNLASVPPVDNPDDDVTPDEGKTRAAAVNGSTLSTAAELYEDAFNLICAVNMRSNPNATSRLPKYDSYKNEDGTINYSAMMALVENERQREFLFEGKRYYDLVRRARREGNNEHFVQAIQNKFAEASKAVLIKMSMPDFVYMPIHEHQLDVNPMLKQNPAYVREDDFVKN